MKALFTEIGYREARIELGEAVASRLKLSKDGTKVLWPQPTDSPNDPQNWSDKKKALHLLIITLAAIVPDFDSGIGKALLQWCLACELILFPGIASLFPLAKVLYTCFVVKVHRLLLM